MNSKETEIMDDHELARRFASMRAQDHAALPPRPDFTDQGGNRENAVSLRRRSMLPRMALAAGVIAAAGILLTRQPAGEDPALLYADIMNGYTLATDELLYVSTTLAPEMTGLSEIMAAKLPGTINEPLH